LSWNGSHSIRSSTSPVEQRERFLETPLADVAPRADDVRSDFDAQDLRHGGY
jgi:hypothetical protein